MGIYESGVHGLVRRLMQVTEARIDHEGELGKPAPGAGRGRSVLLVHGYGNDSASMKGVRDSLKRDGFDVQTIDLPNFGYGDLMQDARLVGRRVRQMTAANGGDPVHVVGHSRGGIVARVWKQLLDGGHTRGRVVTVSSANQGVHLGKFDAIADKALPEGAQQLRRGAELIRRLRRAPATDDVVAVGTKRFDGTLYPASAAKIPGAEFHAVDEDRTLGPFSRIGHWEILRDDASYETIRGALLK